MPFTTIIKPTVGAAIRKFIIDKVIDNLNFFFGIFSSLQAANIPNGSFEIDGDNNGIPDEWDRTLFNGGSFSLDNTAGNFIHGAKAAKFVHPGGASNGGGYLQSADFIDWSEKRPMLLQWSHKSSVAGIRNKVDVLFYDASKSLLATVAAYDSQANPTSWTVQNGGAMPPANTRYAKIKITGGDSSITTGGSSWWDDFRMLPMDFENQFTFTPGTYVWTCPPDVYFAYVYNLGAGAGGGGGDGAGTPDPGGGGGGGALAIKYLRTTPGTDYTIVVGLAGTGGPGSQHGTSGTATTFSGSGITTISGGGGSFGNGDTGGTPGAGGAGGVASGGDVNINGTAGQAAITPGPPRKGGAGGKSAAGWKGGAESTVNGAANPGQGPGAGGGGGTAAGAAGKDGYCLIRF